MRVLRKADARNEARNPGSPNNLDKASYYTPGLFQTPALPPPSELGKQDEFSWEFVTTGICYKPASQTPEECSLPKMLCTISLSDLNPSSCTACATLRVSESAKSHEPHPELLWRALRLKQIGYQPPDFEQGKRCVAVHTLSPCSSVYLT